MRILVMGYNQTIGRQIARKYMREGHVVHGVRVVDLLGDCLDANDLRYDIAFDCGRNLEATAKFLTWADRTHPVRRVLFSGPEVYPDRLRLEPYRLREGDASETDAFLLEAQASQDGFLVLRPFEVYGEASVGEFAQVQRALSLPGKVRLRHCGVVLDFIHVSDVVAAAFACLDQGWAGGPMNLCTGIPTAVDELAAMLNPTLGDNMVCDIDGMSFTCGDPTLMNQVHTAVVDLRAGILIEAATHSNFCVGMTRN